FPIAAGPSNYQYFGVDSPTNPNSFNGIDTLYVADDRANTAGGGIQRWTFDGTNWSLSGTAAYAPGVTPSGFRAITGTITGPNVSLYATSATSATAGSTDLVSVTDLLSGNGGTFGSFTTLATSATNTAFRGVSLG